MAEVKYLDKTGLTSVWSKVKGIVTPKADKVSGATAGHLAGLNSSGNLMDSGLPASNIAQKDGSYSGMTVGAAEDLVSAESVASEFTSRITGGSTAVGKGGTALLDKIKGRTLVWNQNVNTISYNPNFVTLDDSITTEKKYNYNTTAGTSRFIYCGDGNTVQDGHQTLIILTFKNGISGGVYFRYRNGLNVYENIDFTDVSLGSWGKVAVIRDSGFLFSSQSGFIARSEAASGDYFSLPNNGGISVIDLTLMFGAGNEPSTPEEFEALYPGPYYDYNQGTFISNAATAIETVGWNQYDPATGKARVIGGKQYHVGGTYTSLSKDGATITSDASGLFTPDTSGEVTVVGGTSTDTIISLTDPSRNGTYEPYWRSELELNIPTLTGKLNGTGNSVVIFPDGLRSAGTVYDEIVGNKAIKRIGSVDMGSLTWTYASSRFYSNAIETAKAGTTELVSTKYLRNTTNFFIGNNNRLYVVDSSYSDAATFKASMSGVMLYYELATPEEYILDEAIPTAMRNDPYGTERRLPEDTAAIVTAPFRADITYSTNIKEAVQSMPQNYININSMQDFLAALGALMGGTWTMRHADGKFDFTFTPNPSNE